MKTKSIFISTIAMVVLLVVALATGTFAWYVAQNEVNANSATVSAASTSDASLAIGWNSSATTSLVTFGTAGGIRPMIPVVVPSTLDGTTTLLTFNEGKLLINAADQQYIDPASIQPATPWTQIDATLPTPISTLYVINKDTNNDAVVTVKVNIEEHVNGADLNDLLRVAIFYKDGSNYEYIGVWGGGTAIAGNISTLQTEDAGGVSPDSDFYFPSELQNEGTAITLLASGANGTNTMPISTIQANRQIFIYAWFEGNLLTIDNNDIGTGTFSIVFTGAQA